METNQKAHKVQKAASTVANAPLRIIMKAILKACNSLKVVVVVYPLTLLISTLMFVFIEKQKWIDGLYWSVVTSGTVGYGDLSPKTDVGKLVCIMFILFWFVLAAVFIVNLLRYIVQDPDAWTHEEQVELLDTVRAVFANQATIDYNLQQIAGALGIKHQLLPLPRRDSFAQVITFDGD